MTTCHGSLLTTETDILFKIRALDDDLNTSLFLNLLNTLSCGHLESEMVPHSFVVFIDRDVIDPSRHCFLTSGSVVDFLLLVVEKESKTKSAAARLANRALFQQKISFREKSLQSFHLKWI